MTILDKVKIIYRILGSFIFVDLLLLTDTDYITLNVPPVALSIVPLQKMSLSVRQSYDYF